EAVALAQEQRGDQKSADHVEHVHAIYAHAKDRQLCQDRVVRGAPPGMEPHHSNNAEGSQAIERTEETHGPVLSVAIRHARSKERLHASCVNYFTKFLRCKPEAGRPPLKPVEALGVPVLSAI